MCCWKSVYAAVMLITTINIAYADDCDKGESLFEQASAATKRGQLDDAENLLKQSVSVCNRFDSWFLLGRVQQNQESYTSAAASFKDAKKYASNNDEVVLAMSRYAESLAQQGQISVPLSILRKATNMLPNPPKWIPELMLELDKKRVEQPLTVAQVKRGLQGRSAVLLDSDIKPSIDIAINFVFNSTEVSDDTAKNVSVLAEALADSEFNGETAVIVGHADTRGEEMPNLILSEKRARAIADAIIAMRPELDGRILTRGLGETRPLYRGDDAGLQKLNRRIEVYME
ncbi:MAG: OmpA family protein [Gammaproteobacteria bacterium]|nr:OmpA family protein [Gammaproteobacteria bacterium]